MGVEERLSLEAVSADTLIACEHVHRYKLAAALCAGLRVVDLACGSGYGSAILREAASSVVGVDNDAATIDMARVTVGADSDIRFEAADAVEFLNRGAHDEWDAVVCLEGLEHFPEPRRAVEALSELAREGKRLVISLPNSRTFAEQNAFHVTDFGFDEAMDLFAELGDTTVLYQFLAEGSLIRGSDAGALDAEQLLQEHGDPEYANHFIACVNLGDALASEFPAARMHLTVAPVYNRHMLGMERANRELWRENARLARGLMGKSDAAAATALLRVQRDLREQLEEAEARRRADGDEINLLRHRLLVLDTPRHVAVERARNALMRFGPAYRIIRRLWAMVNRA
jgi:SAM-dependent methyltransferase